MTGSLSSSEEFQTDALTRKVLNLDVTFHWISGSDRFWFKRQSRSGDEFILVDADAGERFIMSEGVAGLSPTGSADCVVSRDKNRAIFRRESDLWVRDLTTGNEQRLTYDGEPNFVYGIEDRAIDLEKVTRRRTHSPDPLKGVIWSPNGRFVVVLRQDLRPFPERLLVTEYVSPDRTYNPTHFGRFSVARDVRTPDIQIAIIDTSTSVVRPADLDHQALNDYALHYFLGDVVWWSVDCTELFLITANRGGARYALSSIELATGFAKEILTESARYSMRLNQFDYARPNVHVTSDAREVIWYSERSGHGHLYLYSAASGELKRQLTLGNWVVFDLLRVDEIHRLVYFTAASLAHEGNPYYRHLYRVSFDGGAPQLLTPETADHKFSNYFGGFARFAGGEGGAQPGSSISPSGRYFIDSYSTTERSPEYVLRRTSGELVLRVLASDPTELYDAGWRPPELVVAKASDGITDLYGVITRPRHFEAEKKYAVIDVMYPGPQGSFAPRTFMDQIAGSLDRFQVLADAGFIVVALDGRGTGHRSRAFRDSFLGTEDVFGAADHVAAIRHLAAERPYMDLERVGVKGRSFGGYGALRAMLLFPDFFKVGVSATGPCDYIDMHGQVSVERFFGVPTALERDGCYDVVSNVRLASRLKGRVLLIYGGIDENVPLRQAFSLIDAFIKADKDVDMLIVPDASHSAPKDPYVIRRSIEYFLEHLVGRPEKTNAEPNEQIELIRGA